MDAATAEPRTMRPLTLLVVDDSAMMRTVVKRAATLTGVPIACIHEAENGRQALDILERHDVDALFTDVNMPVMGGVELLRALAPHDRWSHLLRIVISTDGSEARREEARDLKVRMYLEKPFRPEAVRDVLVEVASLVGAH